MENKYKVPAKLWKQFSDEAKGIYNQVMKQSVANQMVTIPPGMPMMSYDEWFTICHNFAVFAAWAIDGRPLKKGDVVIDEKKQEIAY